MSELGRVQHSAWSRRAEQRHSSGRDQEQGTEFQCISWAKRCCSHAGTSQLCNPRMQRSVYQTWPKLWSYKTLGQGEDEQRVSVHKLWHKAAASVLITQRDEAEAQMVALHHLCILLGAALSCSSKEWPRSCAARGSDHSQWSVWMLSSFCTGDVPARCRGLD